MREDKILGLSLTEQLRHMLLVGLEQPFMVFRVELADDTIIQIGKKISQAQADLSCCPDVVPRDGIDVRAPPLQDERLRGTFLTHIPCGSITLFILGSKRNRIFERENLKFAFAKPKQNGLIQEQAIRIQGDPEARQICGKLPQDTISPNTHRAPATVSPIRNTRRALRSGE